MMKKLILHIVFLSSLLGARGQDIHAGLVLGGNVYQKMMLNRGFYSPDNSYHTYVEEDPEEGLLNKNGFFNGIHIGGILNFEYKRFGFNVEPQFYYQRSSYRFEQPYSIERVLGKRAFRLPMYFTFRLFKKTNSTFLLAGLNWVNERNWEFQDPGIRYYFGEEPAYNDQLIVGDNHFNGLLYSNGNYFNYVIGIGKNSDKWTSSIRFQRELDITSHQVEASIWHVEVSFNFLMLSLSDFTKKHFLYVE